LALGDIRREGRSGHGNFRVLEEGLIPYTLNPAISTREISYTQLLSEHTALPRILHRVGARREDDRWHRTLDYRTKAGAERVAVLACNRD
jgi:hypothetical protein